jgi:Helix-turn-helix domain
MTSLSNASPAVKPLFEDTPGQRDAMLTALKAGSTRARLIADQIDAIGTAASKHQHWPSPDLAQGWKTRPLGASRAGSAAMKYEIFRARWIRQFNRDRNLSDGAIRAALAITLYINRKSFDAFPGLESLMEDTGMSRSTVIRAVKQLEAAGHLKVRRTRTSGGKNGVNHYAPILISGVTHDTTSSTVSSHFSH